MNGPSFIEHKGQRVILLDFSGMQGDPREAIPMVQASGRFVQALPADGRSLTCTDVRNTKYDRSIVEAFKEMSKGNRPHVRAAAVVTDSPIHRAAISMVGLFSRRKIETFATREAALDWLVAQS